jgi:hypothetical protein
MPEKLVQPAPSKNAVVLPGMAKTDRSVAPSTPAVPVLARAVRVEPAAEADVVDMLAQQTAFASDPEARAIAVQLLGAGYTVREVSRRLRIRPHIVWAWAEEPSMKTAIERGRELRRRSLGQSPNLLIAGNAASTAKSKN